MALGSGQLHLDTVSLTISTCLSTSQRLASTNILKLPAQTDVTCSGVLLPLCSRPSILLSSLAIWCMFWLISSSSEGFVREQQKKKKKKKKKRAEEKTADVRHANAVWPRSPTPSVDWASKRPRARHSWLWNGKAIAVLAGRCRSEILEGCCKLFSIHWFCWNTSAHFTPWSRISRPSPLLFFFVFLLLNLSTKGVSDFYSVSKFSGVQKKTEFALRLFSDVSKYLANFRIEIWNSETPCFLRKDRRSKLKQTEQLFLELTLRR